MKKTLIAILLLVLITAQDKIFEKHQKEQNFLNYSKRQGKRYSSLEESLYRFSIYKDNLKRIEELNKANPKAKFTDNKFADLTQEEFLAKYGGIKNPAQDKDRKLGSQVGVKNLGSYPASLDLRSELQPIKNQGACGSCWAFNTVSSIEHAYFKKTGYNGGLSEQQLVDCVYSYGGCYGGWMTTAYNYVQKLPGLAWEWDYKYTAESGSCQAASLKSKMSVWLNQTKSYEQVAPNADSIKSALANVGVLSVCVDAYGWAYYESGIYTDSRYEDQTKSLRCTHGVTIVGYGTENGIPYYLIRNSWDTWWGENGYMKMDARQYPNGNTYSGISMTDVYYPIIY